MFDLKEKRSRITLVLIWAIAVGIGTSAMMAYTNQAGASGNPPRHWPLNGSLGRPSNCNMLLMFVHPHCPCSRASLQELAKIMSRTGDRLEAQVVFYEPVDKPNAWSQTDLREIAASIPHVRVVADRDGVISKQFVAKTSGHTLMYDFEGRLVFSGGITAGRGHEGDNIGHTAVLELVSGNSNVPNTCPVFGCPIIESNE